MFNQNVDDRLSLWAAFRSRLENSPTPFVDVWEFWKSAPFVPYNHKVDPYHQRGWPSPWEIIVENKYDDFTKALMIGYSLKLTKRFENDKIELKTLVDREKSISYNVICIRQIAINYSDLGPVDWIKVPDYFSIENLVELSTTR
jgi:hypothetical protein